MEFDEQTNTGRLLHGASHECPGHYAERLGEWILWEAAEPDPQVEDRIVGLARENGSKGVYRKLLSRHIRGRDVASVSPELIFGEAAPDRFTVRENGICYELSFCEGYSYGLFLDQRENRRRFIANEIQGGFSVFDGKGSPALLNTFAYTCGFSVCAAKAGAVTTSLDLSRKYLDWGRRNFQLNGVNDQEHDFIYGDAFDWCRRLAKKDRLFDAIVLDPPTFSKGKGRSIFRAEQDYGRLVAVVLPLLKPAGVLLSSTNAARLEPYAFVDSVRQAIRAAGRSVQSELFVGQPADFPASAREPAYLKTVWMRVS